MDSEKYSTFNPPDELSERIEEKETKISKITHGSSFLFTRIADKCWHVWFDRCVAATLSTEISWIGCTKFRICQSAYLKRPKRCFFTQIFGLAYFSYVFSFHRSFFIIHQRPKYARKRRMRQRKEGTSFLSLVRSADLADRR